MKKLLSLKLAIMLSPSLLVAGIVQSNVEFRDAKGLVLGTGVLTEYRKGVKIDLNVTGLKPGMHALHFHENGKCEAPEFASAGGHYNPTDKEHGTASAKGAHLGDLPNVVADKNGNIKTSIIQQNATLLKGSNTLQKEGGLALIIHSAADDHKTQPAGDSGDRVACAIVNLQK